MKSRDQIQLCMFDLILCDNDLLYDKPLHQIGVQILNEIGVTPDTNLLPLIQQSVAAGCEGLVVKKLDSRYSFGSRNRSCEREM